MNYIQDICERLRERLPQSDLDPELARFYALLVLTRGWETTRQDVHDAWSAWRDCTDPEHHSLIPFGELAPDVQALDQPYMDAICAVAEDLAGNPHRSKLSK